MYTDPLTGKFLPGNPGGKGRGTISIVGLIREQLAKVEPVTKKTYAQLVTERYVLSALKGDNKLLRDLVDRIDGKALQHVLTTTTTLNEILDQVEGKIPPTVGTIIQEKLDAKQLEKLPRKKKQ